MRILPVNLSSLNNCKNLNHNSNTSSISQNDEIHSSFELSNHFYMPISFTSEDLEYKRAKQYLDNEIYINGVPSAIKELDLNKLNGIQNGIKIFDGLNMKEIAFLCDQLSEIAVYRGCSGYCGHCYVDAKKPIKEDDHHINRMSFEDYKLLTDGFKTLRERLGFSPSNYLYYEISLFRDADCLEMELKDKKGNTYDFIDLANMANDAFDKKVLFDTHGWSKSNTKLQKRAEKFVEYYSKPENANKLSQINISINPFSWLNMQVVKAVKEKDFEKAQRNAEIYSSRMANVLFTFTPLLKNKNFDIIVRAFSDDLNADFAVGYRVSDIRNLNMMIISNLAKMYRQDLNGDKRVIKSKKDMYENLDKFLYLLNSEIETNLSVSGRLKNIIPKDHKNLYNRQKSMQCRMVDDYILDLSKNLFYNANFSKTIDANGQIYITNPFAVIPTQLKLNLENKDKLTAKFDKDEYPALPRKFINNAEDFKSINDESF